MVPGMPAAGGPRVKRLAQPEAEIRPRSLGLPRGRPVIALFGTTGTLSIDLAAGVLPVLRAVVARAGRDGAVVVTGAADTGVIHLLGVATESCEGPLPFLVGVAPSSRIATGDEQPADNEMALERHHDVVVVVPGSHWGEELPALHRVADTARSAKRPPVGLLVGGGEAARTGVVAHLGADWPLVVLAGSGRLADEIASGELGPEDDLAVLVRGGQVTVVHLDEGPERVVVVLRRLLGMQPPVAPPLAVWPRLRFRAPEPEPVIDPGYVVEHPLLADAIHEANRVVAPALQECEAEVQREHNRQRLFALLAIGAGLAVTASAALQTWLRGAAWPGVLVAAAGTCAAVLTVAARREEPVDGPVSPRRRAEKLRSLYFAHLAAPPPDSDEEQEDRVRALESVVADRRFEAVRP
jgi:hypothetical protein